jgi:hypothetical protein
MRFRDDFLAHPLSLSQTLPLTTRLTAKWVMHLSYACPCFYPPSKCRLSIPPSHAKN